MINLISTDVQPYFLTSFSIICGKWFNICLGSIDSIENSKEYVLKLLKYLFGFFIYVLSQWMMSQETCSFKESNISSQININKKNIDPTTITAVYQIILAKVCSYNITYHIKYHCEYSNLQILVHFLLVIISKL